MSTVSIKICGLKTVESVQSVLHLPIDHIGFVFAPSKRQVTAEQAAQMITVLQTGAAAHIGVHERAIAQQASHSGSPGRVTVPRKVFQAVGVFVNPTIEELHSVLNVAPLDIIQLHGNESPEFCRKVRAEFQLPVFKFMPISSVHGVAVADEVIDDTGLSQSISASLDAYAEWIEALLLDTFDPRVAGGSGKTFDWAQIPRYLEWARTHGVQLIVAGGLDTDNVRFLIEQYQPDGVDVSSGVETDGIKDTVKIEQFVQQVWSTQ